MKRTVSMLVLATLIFIVGCSKQQSEGNDVYKKHEQPMAEFEEVFTLGLYEGNEFEYERTFKLEDGLFRKSVVLGNRTSKEEDFVLVIFNHGKQIEFTLGNEDAKQTHYKFTVKPDEYMNLDVTLKELTHQYNSITYIILKNPDEAIHDADNSMELTDLFSIRVNLYDGIDEVPKERPTLSTKSIKSDKRTVHGVLLSDSDELYKVMYKERVEDNQPYTLIYGSSFSEYIDFYLVGLNNFEQVPLGNQDYIFDKLKPGEEKSVSLNFDFTMKENNNIFQVIMIPYPFESVTQDSPFLSEDPLASNRVLLTK